MRHVLLSPQRAARTGARELDLIPAALALDLTLLHCTIPTDGPLTPSKDVDRTLRNR